MTTVTVTGLPYMKREDITKEFENKIRPIYISQPVTTPSIIMNVHPNFKLYQHTEEEKKKMCEIVPLSFMPDSEKNKRS